MKCPNCGSDMPKLSGQKRSYTSEDAGYPQKPHQFQYHVTISPLWACLECHSVIWDDIPKEKIAEIKALNKKRERASRGTDILPATEPKPLGQKAIEDTETS